MFDDSNLACSNGIHFFEFESDALQWALNDIFADLSYNTVYTLYFK